MKLFKQLRFIILFITIVIVLVSIRRYNKNYFVHSVEEAFELSCDSSFYLTKHGLSALNNYTLIDLRTKDLLAKSHLENTIHIEFKNLLKRPSQRLLEQHDTIVLYSDEISESVKAKSLLNQMGYITVYILDPSANKASNDELNANSHHFKNEDFIYKFQPDTLLRLE